MDLRERRLELERPRLVGLAELPPDLPFAQPQEQLLGGALVDALCRSARVELCQEADELGIGIASAEQVFAGPPV